MISEYVLGGIIASLLGFLLMYSLQKKKREITGRIECAQSFENEEYQLGFTKSIDVIIVGAGLAGSALAYSLGKDGRQVHVIERDLTEPDRIVGEVLQPGGYLKLIELDLADCVNEIDAQRVLGYALYMDGKSIKLPYALEDFHSDVGGRSFHYGRLIRRMREKAASLPNVRLEQGTVTSLLQEKGTIKGVHYRTETGQETTAYAPLTVVCDGGFSKLRRSLSEPKVDVPSSFVGLILENSHLPFPNYAHVIMTEPSLILFYPISSTEIRCLVDIPGRKVPSIYSGKMAHYLTTVVAPQIPSTLCDAFISAVDKGNIRTMPNSCMPAAPYPTPGALLLGDALNMRHPLTGGGMTAALSDVVLLRHLLKPLDHLNDASSYIESFYTLRKPVAFTLNAVAGVFQKLSYASSDQVRCEMRRACFSYLSRGGVFASGLVALLSALNPCPWTLALHLFLVSSYTIGRLLLPFPSPKRIWLGARFIADGLCIIFSIIKAEGVGPILFPATLLRALQVSPIIRNNVVMALFGIRSNCSIQPPLVQ